MTPAIGFILAALFTAAPLTYNGANAQGLRTSDVLYECPETYKVTMMRTGEVVCLRYRRDLVK